MPDVFTPQKLFQELPPSFSSYQEFEEAFFERFNAHIFDFPPQYRWRDALDWGLRSEAVKREGGQIVVTISQVAGRA